MHHRRPCTNDRTGANNNSLEDRRAGTYVGSIFDAHGAAQRSPCGHVCMVADDAVVLNDRTSVDDCVDTDCRASVDDASRKDLAPGPKCGAGGTHCPRMNHRERRQSRRDPSLE